MERVEILAEKALTLSLFPWVTSWRIAGFVITETLDLVEELRR